MSKQIKLPTLLVISENPKVRFWVKKHLDDQFFILTAESEADVWRAISSRLDFIIVDASLEQCDALELCKEIRKKLPLEPIFLITGRLKKSFRDKAQQSGVTDFLSDQLDLDELNLRIQSGRKAATVREKTVDLGLAIKPMPQAVRGSLKTKMVLNDQALKTLANAKAQHKPVASLFLRIDHFSEWENRDEIFHSLGQFIRNLLREKDVLIPSTEGSYILLLYNTFPEAGKKIAQRLKEKINYHPFSAMRKLTVSIAVSSLEADEKGFQKMLDGALKSLKTEINTNFIISLEEED